MRADQAQRANSGASSQPKNYRAQGGRRLFRSGLERLKRSGNKPKRPDLISGYHRPPDQTSSHTGRRGCGFVFSLSRCIRAETVRSAWLTARSAKALAERMPLLLYLLSRDGRVDEISVPYAPSEHLIEPQPVASGWIFGGGDFYKSSGLYFFDGKIVQKLDAGLVHMTAVSQDGCRAAVAIATNHLEARAPIRLKMFRFCGEK